MPWQRGYNGNAHGLLQYSYPRGYNFLGVSQAGLGHVLNLASHRPRGRPNWHTPFGAFSKAIAFA